MFNDAVVAGITCSGKEPPLVFGNRITQIGGGRNGIAQNHIHPVCVGKTEVFARIQKFGQFRTRCVREVACSHRGLTLCQIANIQPLLSAQYAEIFAHSVGSHLCIEGKAACSLPGLPGSDNDDAARRLCTVDTCRGCVLEHLNAFNFVRIQSRRIGGLYAVYDPQRAGAPEYGGEPPDGNLGVVAAGHPRRGEGQAGYFRL